MAKGPNSLQAVLERQARELPEAPLSAEPSAPSARKRAEKQEPRAGKFYRASREGKRLVAGHFPPELAKQLKLLAAEEDTTIQALLEEALGLLFVKKGRKAFNTVPQYLPLPVIFDHAKTRELVANDTHIKHIMKLREQSSIAVLTVGTVRDSALLFKLGYFTKQEQLTLQHEAVGDVFSRFIDSKGQIVNEDINQRTIGIALPELRKKKHSILVAANVAKVPAVHGVLSAGYANTLVIDQESANSLVNF